MYTSHQKVEPEAIIQQRRQVYNDLIKIGCSPKQATALSYRTVPRTFLSHQELITLGYVSKP